MRASVSVHTMRAISCRAAPAAGYILQLQSALSSTAGMPASLASGTFVLRRSAVNLKCADHQHHHHPSPYPRSLVHPLQSIRSRRLFISYLLDDNYWLATLCFIDTFLYNKLVSKVILSNNADCHMALVPLLGRALL